MRDYAWSIHGGRLYRRAFGRKAAAATSRHGGDLSGLTLCGGQGCIRALGLRGRQRPQCRRSPPCGRVSWSKLPSDRTTRLSRSPGDGSAGPDRLCSHGDRDTTVHPRNGDHHVIAQSMGAASVQSRVQRGRVPGGRAYTRTIHATEDGRAILERLGDHTAGRARLVGRQPRRLLHRSAWAGRRARDAAFLPRARAPGGAAPTKR